MHTTAELNKILAERLGLNPYGEGVFQWAWSEDLFWPEFPTGRMVQKTAEVPIIGGAVCPSCKGSGEGWSEYGHEPCLKCGGGGKIFKETITTVVGPEYRKERMAPNLDHQWVMTIWYPPESLEQWSSNFPGAAYPTRGFRIHTNASLPSFPGGPREPNITDTERFIQLLNFQRSHTHAEVATGIDNERYARDAAIRREIEDEIRDDFPAQMNLNPGARGGWVSFPYSKKDLQ